MNNRGQELILGIMIMVMALIIFIGVIPAISNVFDTTRQCNYLNCNGYVDNSASAGSTTCTATNRSYNPSGNNNDFACTIVDLGIPYLILGVLVALISKLIYGRLVEKTHEVGMYPGY